MELKDYIKGVITQLDEGINEELKDKGGAYIVAKNLSDTNESIIKTKEVDGKERIVALIDFEIPIEAEDPCYANNNKGRINVVNLNFNNPGTPAYLSTLKKIKFLLPLAMPDFEK